MVLWITLDATNQPRTIILTFFQISMKFLLATIAIKALNITFSKVLCSLCGYLFVICHGYL